MKEEMTPVTGVISFVRAKPTHYIINTVSFPAPFTKIRSAIQDKPSPAKNTPVLCTSAASSGEEPQRFQSSGNSAIIHA